jgi:hypothetical protein
MTDDTQTLRNEIQSVGRKVDSLVTSAELDRKFLQGLHADHLRLENRVRLSEERLMKTQGDLDKHVEVACVIQEATRKDVTEIKETLKFHTKQEDIDRREIIRHLREQSERESTEGKKTLMWAIGVGVSVVVTLFALLWGTGAVG